MTQRIFTVLTIDGGGVRGIVTARVLQEIEERTGKPIAELFDLVSGSSTGAILTASLTAPDEKDPTKPRHTAEDMKDMYINYSKKIFPPSKFRQLKHFIPGMSGFFDPKNFETILEERLGDLELKDSLTHIMIPGADMKTYQPVWMSYFHNADETNAKFQKWARLKTKDAVRASASPPTIFPVKYIYTQPNKNNPQAKDRHAFLDGSLFAGTITRRAHTAAKKIAPKNARIVLVSLGTGYSDEGLTPDEMNRKTPLEWINSSDGPNLISTCLDLTVRDVMNDLKEELGDDMFRIDKKFERNTPNDPDISIINATDSNIKRLIKAAEDTIIEHDERIDKICEVLMARHEMEQAFQKGYNAYETLNDMLNHCENIGSLNKVYSQIVDYASAIEHVKVSKKNQDMYDLCKALLPTHKTLIEKAYALQRDYLIEKQNNKKSFWHRFNMFSKKTPGKPEKPNTPPIDPPIDPPQGMKPPIRPNR